MKTNQSHLSSLVVVLALVITLTACTVQSPEPPAAPVPAQTPLQQQPAAQAPTPVMTAAVPVVTQLPSVATGTIPAQQQATTTVESRSLAPAPAQAPAPAPVAAPSLPIRPECTGPGSKGLTGELTGKVRFIGTEADKPITRPVGVGATAAPELVARAYLIKCGDIFGIGDQKSELKVLRERVVDKGRGSVRFQQLYLGVPVFGGELAVTVDEQRNITSVTSRVMPGISLKTAPTVDAITALRSAVEAVATEQKVSSGDLVASQPSLSVYVPALVQSSGSPALVWLTEVSLKNKGPVDYLVLVDAQKGAVALHFNRVDTVRDNRTYTASNTQTVPGALLCGNSDTTCTNNSDGKAVHTSINDTYAFYSTNHGRDSIDDNGMGIVTTVHYSSGYCNAYWTPTYQQFVFGDGCAVAQGDDVVGHEYTHGVTQNESGLVYHVQSGAINESFSDLWGEWIDLSNSRGLDTAAVRWQLGEDVTGVGPFRDMKNPPAKDDPDKMTSSLYYVGADDYNHDWGGVHTNSGVGNKAGYLITDGGTFNGQTVTGIGITKAAKIFYEAQVSILTSSADYTDLYFALRQACNNLVGTSGITDNDCLQVQKATQATEMNPAAIVAFPHYQSFIATVARPVSSGMGWLFGRENDNTLAAATLQATATANVGDSSVQTLLNVPGLGGVRDTGDPNKRTKLVVFSSGSVVEYSLWYGTTYTQGEVAVNATREIEIPNYKSFIITIGRHQSSGMVFGRLNDDKVVAATASGNANAMTSDRTKQTLIDVPGLGGVRDTGDPNQRQKLQLYSNSTNVMEYSLWYGGTYIQGEVPGNGTKEIDFPHYQSFAITIARNDKIGWVFGRENDGYLTAVTLKTTATAVTNDAKADVLVDVAGIGGIKDSGVTTAPRSLRFYTSRQDSVEYTMWYGSTYLQGEASP